MAAGILQIYHDGFDSYVKDAGSGNLTLQGTNLNMYNSALSKIYLNATDGGSVDLYYDNSKKLATTSTGVDVTGYLTADGLNVENTSGYGSLEVGGSSGGLLDFKAPFSDDFDSRIIANGTNFTLDNQNAGSIIFNNNLAERMRITSSGNVGIGTTNPSTAKLEVHGLTSINGNAPASDYALNITGSSGVNGGLVCFDSTVSASTTLVTTTSGGYLNVRENLPLHFNTNNTERMRIDGNGRVGIGVSSMNDATLEIQPASDIPQIKLTQNNVPDGGDGWKFHNSGPTGGNLAIIREGSGVDTEYMRITTSGNVGIGTNSPAQLLHVNSTGNVAAAQIQGASHTAKISTDGAGAIFGTTTNGYMLLTTNSAERMRIDVSGNLLVGTTDTTLYNNTSGDGLCYRNGASLDVTAASDNCLILNRNTTDGGIAEFRKDGTIVGTIVTNAGAFVFKGASTSQPVQLQTHDGNEDIEVDPDGFIKMETAGSERLRINSSGNVGIGTSSPSSNLHVEGGAGANIAIKSTAGRHWRIGDGVGSSNGNFVIYDYTNSTARLTIDTTGSFFIKRTSTYTYANGSLCVEGTGGNPCIVAGTSGTTFYNNVVIGNGNGNVGSISTNGSSTSFNTSSDYRLKENVVNLTGATTRLKQLEPKRFNFIADADKTVDGFIAHEAQAVVPEAVTGIHNEVDADGNAVMQGIDQSKLVPLLTAALQEAIAKIETLETEMTSVRARLDALEAN